MPDQATLRRWTRKALSSDPRTTAALGVRKVRGVASARAERQSDMLRATYSAGNEQAPRLGRFLGSLSTDIATPSRPTLDPLVDRYLEHRFDLLGSGWVHVHPGMTCEGLEGHVYSASERPEPSVNRANRRRAAQVRHGISADYEPIDWQLDFKSGYRWSEETWFRDVEYGHRPGADVKVPWELGRSQHLPQLALAAIAAAACDDGARVSRLWLEYQDWIRDFVASNPPRFGVQWTTTMDVAIRAANWLLAFDLFRCLNLDPDLEFEELLGSSILDHGHYIAANLEWFPEGRANHYLADVVGLLFVAAYLPPSRETDAWLVFSARELASEAALQFNDDGGNFEGSTSYHRLSFELLVYGAALLSALPTPRSRQLVDPSRDVLAAMPQIPDGAGAPLRNPVAAETLLTDDLLSRIARAAEFTIDFTKPDGRVPQFGDNDNGRLFRLAPVVLPGKALAEDHLDHRHVMDAAAGLLGFLESAPEVLGVDGAIIRTMSCGRLLGSPLVHSRAANVRIGDRHVLADAVARLQNLPPESRWAATIELGSSLSEAELVGYPVTGMFVARTDRVYLAIRCGPRGQRGLAGHDHNDQLTVELHVDGADWIRDPGTYLYTPVPEMRNRYRSVRAHFAPQLEGPEPSSLDEGLFRLGRGNGGTCSYWGEAGFFGQVRYADGRVAICRVELLASAIRVTHAAEGTRLLASEVDSTAWRGVLPTVAYSRGYGYVEC